MLRKEGAEIDKNKMASLECGTDDEAVVLNKRVCRQIVANVKDDRTGSMMPVVLEKNGRWNKIQSDREKDQSHAQYSQGWGECSRPVSGK